MGYIGADPALNESVTAAQIVDGTIVAADVADNAVTLAKMAGGTDGNVISYDASGDPVAIATGSDGQVLTSTGAGSPPAFEALPSSASAIGDLSDATTASTSNVGLGSTSLDSVSGGNYNTAVGINAGTAVTSGDDNVFIGFEAGDATTDVDKAIIIGSGAAGANMTADADGTIAIGYQAGLVIADGQFNTVVGYQALKAQVSGDSSTAIGYQALKSSAISDGDVGNTAIGYKACEDLTTGQANIAIGIGAMKTLTTGGTNICIGRNTMVDVDAGSSSLASGGNVFIGDLAASGTWTDANTSKNIGIGNACMDAAMDGAINNVAMGADGALGALTSGDNNTCIGYATGDGITSGSNNTCLGKFAGTSQSGKTITSDNNQFVAGNSDVTHSYIKVDWTVGSDERDKADITDFTHGLDYVNELRPVNFVWDDRHKYVEIQVDEDGNNIPMTAENIANAVRDGSKKGTDVQLGFIAQEVQAIEDSLGIDNHCIVDTKDPNKLGMTTAKLVPVLVNAIQELSSKVTALENA